MSILVTGGIGFIGSHTVVELQNAGYDVVILDNLSNAKVGVLDRIEAITGKKAKFYEADIRDRKALENIFANENIDSCIHFAGLKAVGESVQKPLEYYDNNIAGTLVLLDVMRKNGCKNIIFSSSAAPVHVLLVPKTHAKDVTEAAPELVAYMMGKVKEIAASLGVAEKGFRLVINTGDDGGQTVKHLHIHLIGGKELGWPPC